MPAPAFSRPTHEEPSDTALRMSISWPTTANRKPLLRPATTTMASRVSNGTSCETASSSAIAQTAKSRRKSVRCARAAPIVQTAGAAVPIVRIANIGLEPGSATLDQLLGDVTRGIYIEGHGSYSIDQRRYNFQFGGDAFWLIENGKRTHMVRDVVYHGITPEFWGSCDGVADRSYRRRYGFITCGKGQPAQSGWMTHAASHARFRNVNVIGGQAGS